MSEIDDLQKKLKKLKLQKELEKLGGSVEHRKHEKKEAKKKEKEENYENKAKKEINELLKKKEELKPTRQGILGKIGLYANRAAINRKINMNRQFINTKNQTRYLSEQNKLLSERVSVERKKNELKALKKQNELTLGNLNTEPFKGISEKDIFG